jgi:hypothetical protein
MNSPPVSVLVLGQGEGILKECVSSLVVGGDVQDTPAYVRIGYFEAIFILLVFYKKIHFVIY